jgi:hypothetical protein
MKKPKKIFTFFLGFEIERALPSEKHFRMVTTGRTGKIETYVFNLVHQRISNLKKIFRFNLFNECVKEYPTGWTPLVNRRHRMSTEKNIKV